MSPKKKRLFVAMPYGTRKGPLDHSKPDELKEIDFDLVWENMLEPTIPRSRFEAKRADTTGRLGLIDRVYVEWLADSDVVLADLTFGNANVYYELGIRHALSNRGAVLVAQEGTVPPFDLRNQTIFFYDVWNAGTFLEFQKTLKNAISEAETDPTISPVHLYKPGLFVKSYEDGETPEREIERLGAKILTLEGNLAELRTDRTQRLVDKIEQADSRQRLLSLAHQIQETEAISVRVLESIAQKLAASELFDDAIAALERAIRIDDNDAELYRELGFAYRLKGRDHHDKARQNFEAALAINDSDAELHGMIGGMLKREKRLDEAHEHYKKAYELDSEDLYSVVTMGAISAALHSDEYRRYYQEVLDLCELAIQRDTQDQWTYFCMGEAHVAFGDAESALEDYAEALKLEPPRAHIRSAGEALGFLADNGIQRNIAVSIQEQVLWPRLQEPAD